ncbi:MAG: sulfite exporter TauE/SafE [Halieaceae bacterium]
MTTLDLVTALGLGIAGAGHCLGMCGGIAMALGLGQSSTRPIASQLAYHLGRILSYTLLGVLAGFALGLAGGDQPTVLKALRVVAGLMLIALGLYIAGWWRVLGQLEKMGARLWQPIRRQSSRWLPVRHPGHALAVGLCWGAMPCGLIYSSLAWAATAANWAESGLMMLFFGIGTVPAMLATTLFGTQVQAAMRSKGWQRLIAIGLIASGIWTLYGVAIMGMGGHADHHGM